ncbi:hypothetical protein FEM48_Zijuj07G0013600 [Ziziphus jujuba var. spinosa]|uniref:Cinnamoyl-CoA reductase 1-like n=1 Tax=Ziziphus jujuba var. spinosa TaxID=714518 RepID=A0A978V1M1_ZIZJJ|nr:hypothetical protein FEM48_Zijuj07G0013600 [Ziziphus jujuba var. spinosa]
MVSLPINGKAPTPDVVVDETWFSDPAVCEELKVGRVSNWYALLKSLAEEATWKFAKENKNDLVTMHPGFTIGSQTLANMVYRWENEKPHLPIYHVSNEKAKGLGIDFISLEVSLRDTVECFKEKGFLIM